MKTPFPSNIHITYELGVVLFFPFLPHAVYFAPSPSLSWAKSTGWFMFPFSSSLFFFFLLSCLAKKGARYLKFSTFPSSSNLCIRERNPFLPLRVCTYSLLPHVALHPTLEVVGRHIVARAVCTLITVTGMCIEQDSKDEVAIMKLLSLWKLSANDSAALRACYSQIPRFICSGLILFLCYT